jgi:hypothetical protein
VLEARNVDGVLRIARKEKHPDEWDPPVPEYDPYGPAYRRTTSSMSNGVTRPPMTGAKRAKLHRYRRRHGIDRLTINFEVAWLDELECRGYDPGPDKAAAVEFFLQDQLGR